MSRTTTNPSRLMLGLFALIGIGLALFGATFLRGMVTAPEGWVTVDGVVVAVTEQRSSDGTTYAPVAEYVVDGTPYRIVSNVASSSVPRIGETIEVAYDPASPGSARVTGGVAAIAWLLVVGFGLVFALIPGIVLVGGMGGRSGKQPLEGYAVADRATERTRFNRARGNVVLQLILPWVGAVAFLAFAWFLLGRGFPEALFALLAGFFGVFMLLGGIAAVGRGLDPRAIEVGPDGVWLPGIGQRSWDEFSDVRLERYTAPAGGSDHGGATRVASYRRLGFVPRDPDLASRRNLGERLGGGMGIGFYRLMSRLMGREPIDFAPFGVMEAELGREAFERLLELVETYRFLVTAEERPSEIPSPLAGIVRSDDEAG